MQVQTVLQHYDEEFSLDIGRRNQWHAHRPASTRHNVTLLTNWNPEAKK
jgi:hypothetical protein